MMSMTTAWEIIFWVCLLATVWPYLFYPTSLVLLRSRKHRTGMSLPDVTLLISAYNEEAVIGEKLRNALSLDYPGDRIEVVVVSDASDDRTDEIVNSVLDPRVRLIRLDSREGKSAGITRAVPGCRGDVIVFSDANSIYAADALRSLVRHFEDATVGYTVGCQKYEHELGQAADSEGLYWSLEVWLKQKESRVGSVVGGDGAIYAIRKSLFEPLQFDDISDFTLPLRIVSKGFRGIFDPSAVCFERTAGSFESEFRRKVRIVTRSFRAVLRVPQALNPLRVGVFAYQLVSHKLLRWLMPFFLVVTAVTSVFLANTGNYLYICAAAMQAAIYIAAGIGTLPVGSRLRVFYLPYYFVLMNVAAAIGVLGAILGRRYATWNPQRPIHAGIDPANVEPARSSIQ